jgi:hypothetical protein
MASDRAIATVGEAVVQLLHASYRPEDFNNELEFRVYAARDFLQPMTAGVSLFIYRVYVNGTHRTPAGRLGRNGQRYRTQLPVDVHFLLTVWGRDASLQHAIAGWMMRVLEDTPILPAGLLNAVAADVFHQDETVEVGLTELSTEDMLRLWDALVQQGYQLSVPYVARMVHLESRQLVSAGLPVQERGFDYRDTNGSRGTP